MAQILDDPTKRNQPDAYGIQSDRYSEVRTPSFLGGDIDPLTGNLRAGTQQAASVGSTVAPLATSVETLEPAEPTSKLASVGSEVEQPSIYEQVGDPLGVLPSGVSKAVGMSILAPLNPIGALTGDGSASSFLDPIGIFCYVAGTRVRMADGRWKNIEDIVLGDEVMLGGAVIGRGEAFGVDLRRYRDTVVEGSHGVFENGRFIRVRDSEFAPLADVDDAIVYPIVTQHHLMVLETHIAADFAEIDDAFHINDVQRIEALNANLERNKWLSRLEREFGFAVAEPA